MRKQNRKTPAAKPKQSPPTSTPAVGQTITLTLPPEIAELLEWGSEYFGRTPNQLLCGAVWSALKSAREDLGAKADDQVLITAEKFAAWAHHERKLTAAA